MVIIGNGTPNAPQLPNDRAIKSNAPPVLPLDRSVGGSVTQNAAVQADLQLLRDLEATDFRVNQQQLNGDGCRVGICRPDLQATLPDGRQIIIEYDTSASRRGGPHGVRRNANDGDAIIILRIVD